MPARFRALEAVFRALEAVFRALDVVFRALDFVLRALERDEAAALPFARDLVEPDRDALLAREPFELVRPEVRFDFDPPVFVWAILAPPPPSREIRSLARPGYPDSAGQTVAGM